MGERMVELMVAAAGYGKTSLLRHRHPGATWKGELGPFGEGVTIIDDLPDLTAERAQALLAQVEQLPAGARLVIATRFPLPVSTARLRGRGLLAEVRPAELALSADQVVDLLALDYGVRDPDLAEEIFDATGGWPALVRLAGEAVAAGEPVLPEPGSPLWTFLSEEVLAPLPEPARALLTDIADLAPVSADLGEALGHRDAASSLRLLAAIGLLRDDRVVPMVAHVARDGSAPGRVAMLAALWYEEAGHPSAALKAFAQAGSTIQCGRLLEAYGEQILSAGHGTLVTDVLQRIDNRSRKQQLLLGDAVRMAGSALGAQQIYALIADAEPVWDSALAWRVGMLNYHRGESKEALARFDRAPAEEPPSRDRSYLLSWKASAHLQLGDTATAFDLANAACRNASAAGDDLALATAYATLALCNNVSGRDADSEELYVQALELAEKAGSVVLRARLLTSRTFRLLCEAKYDEALEAARQNAECAALAGHTNLRWMAFSNQGDALMMLGRYDEAIRQYSRAEAVCRRIGSRRSAIPHLGLGEVYRRRGWAEQARASYETALELAEDGGLHQVRVQAMCGLARLLAPVDPDCAKAHAELASGLASDREVVPALLARGWVAWHAGDRQNAIDLATDAAKQARADRDPAGLAESLELRAAAEADPARARTLLREALSVWTRAGALAEAARIQYRLGHLIGAGTDDRLGALQATETLARVGIAVEAAGAAAVLVKTFGRFEVWLDGLPVPPTQWQSRKARDLLRVLVAKRGRPVPRDELSEMLWPGENASAHRLSVLLSIVRRVLDPERTLAQDHYVVADQASIGLDISCLRVDVEEFLSDVTHARRLRERGALDEAERLLSLCIDGYRADVFADEPYEEWSVAVREEARGGYVSALRMLAQITRKRGRTGAAVAHLLRLLSVDPYDEAGHRALIEALVAGGQHGEAQRARDRYREAMRAIGVKPA